MLYAKVVDNNVDKYPYTLNDLKKDHPNTSFPKDIFSGSSASDYNVFAVAEVEIPFKLGWKAIKESPVLVDGSWSEYWTLVPKEIRELDGHEITDVEAPVQEGFIATSGDPELVGDVWHATWSLVEGTWLENRTQAYGAVEEQIEFITERGLEAWQAEVANIKALYPKPA
jgi:hypothetical protein